MEAPNTLADALLDDLDDLSDVEEQQQDEAEAKDEQQETSSLPTTANGDSANAQMSRRHSTLLDDESLKQHLQDIRQVTSNNQQQETTLTKKELERRDYQLLVQSNKQLHRLANELVKAHGQLCNAYHHKFPELEELIPNPLQYKNAVSVIRNQETMDMSTLNDSLGKFLSSNQVLTVSVSASTTSGRQLTTQEWNSVQEALTYIDEIVQVQQELQRFVENRMQSVAPNVCALVGQTALVAQLVGLAGGLEELSKIPACNLQVLGQVKQSSAARAGLSSNAATQAIVDGAVATRPNEGILVQCDLVQRLPKHMQKKALKAVAAKLALAARCDFVHNNTGSSASIGTSGQSFRSEIERKFQKWQEPDKAPVLKALPKPDLTIKKRRGGKRIRRMKEKFEETAMMKQANTRAFSAQAGEYGDDAMGLTMGLLDTADVTAGGNLRKTTEKRKMKYANTKASRKRAAQMSTKAPTSGLASSMVFTPVQGMELVNPDANKERVQQANRKWFSEHAGFQSALPKKG